MKLTLDNIFEDPSIVFSKKVESSDSVSSFDCNDLLKSLKNIIDPVIKSSDGCVLDEIYIDGLDATQVWAQAKMVYDNVEHDLMSEINDLKPVGVSINEDDEDEQSSEQESGESESEIGENPDEDAEVEDIDSQKEEEEEEQDSEEIQNESESEDDQDEVNNEFKSKDDFGLNDEFFNLDDYKRQVLALEDEDADKLESDGEGEEIDLFADLSDDDEEDEMYTYDDFFEANKKHFEENNSKQIKKRTSEKKSKKSKKFAEEDFDDAYNLAQSDLYGEASDDVKSDNEQDNNSTEHLSTFEKQQRELQKEIAALEAESIAEKKWTMKGEVSGRQRKSDTLLDEELEFDRTAKPVPVITQETTETIEEIIKRRILNEEFDEIPKRIISELNNFRQSKKVQVSEEKSTKSLAELYEDEYAGKANTNEVTEELSKVHNEITELFNDVTYQLDSLYSSHFVPKPKEKLLDVRIETSTIQMEDAQPLTMANSNTLAPQEIYKTGSKISKDEVVLRSGVVMAKAELDRDDKQRLHRAKKRKQHLQSKDESLKKQKTETKQL